MNEIERSSSTQTGAEGTSPDGAASVEGDRQPSAPQSTTVCDFTDLRLEECAHCLGHIAPEPREVFVLVGNGRRARFDSRCPSCEHLILEDDPIYRTSEGSWICGGCAAA